MNLSQPIGLKVAFATLGCKVNQAESEAMMAEFAGAGYDLADFEGPSDVYILNSCTVTHIADRKSRQLVRQARRHNPEALVVVTGCYAEIDGKDIAATIGADLIVGNAQKSDLVALVGEKMGWRPGAAASSVSPQSRGLTSRTRAMVKVQDGCNNFCSYCIVPLARGRERSVPLDVVLGEVQRKVEAGYKEVVLTGVHAGAYGKGLPGRPTLVKLVERILAETSLQRLRLSSIEPWDLEPALLGFLKDRRFCRHFHLPLQSGSDGVLKRMRRRYSTTEFSSLLADVRAVDPDVAITTDVIVGFPGESEEEFAESLNFCREMSFARIHVFRYSPRRDTRAAGMPDQVDERVKKGRSEAMMALSDEEAGIFRRRFIGRQVEALWEHPKKSKGTEGKLWTGLTDNYVRVDAVYRGEIGNQILPVRISAESGDGLWGAIPESTLVARRR